MAAQPDSPETRPTVILGGSQILLADVIAAHLSASDHANVVTSQGPTAERFRDALISHPSVRPVGLILDPIGTAWSDVASELRLANEKIGIVVVTARPDYAKVRLWKDYVRDNVPRANALLTLNSTHDDLVDAIVDVWKRPGVASSFWPDGPKHPFAHGLTEEGKVAAEILANRELHSTLLLEARGVPRRAAAKKLGDIQAAAIGERLAKLRDLTGARSNVQLGHLATKLGLLDDIEGIDVN